MNIVQGSIGSHMQTNNMSMAEAWLNVDVVVMMDVSGSMAITDAGEEVSRFKIANSELAKVQSLNPGKVAIIEFSDTAKFIPFGELSQPEGSTNVTAALQFARMMDKVGDIKFLLVSDGEPNNPTESIEVARSFTHRIDTIYVGPKGKQAGQDFLRQLSTATGGDFSERKISELSSGIAGYLN